MGLRDSAGTIRVTKRFQALPGSRAAKLLSAPAARAENLLGSLPAQPYAVAGAFVQTRESSQALMEFGGAIMKGARGLYHLSPQQVDQILAGSKGMMQHFRGTAMVMGPPAADKTLYSNLVALVRTDDSQAVIDAYQKYAQDYNAAVKDTEGPMGPMEVAKLQIEGLPGVQISMDMSKAMGMRKAPIPKWRPGFSAPTASCTFTWWPSTNTPR